MLDDCKGERLEEILATFSNAVLKKVVQNTSETATAPIAQRLAFENFSYSGERTALSTLILAHKSSLHSHLREKENANARYHDFAELLNLNDRRITRRHEQLKQATQNPDLQDMLSTRDIQTLQDQVASNWSGREEWLETILYGDTKVRREGLLAANFDSVWRHVEDGSIGDIEEKNHTGLLEQLDARVRNQKSRLARWQDFGKTLSKSESSSATTTKGPAKLQEKRINLDFNLHQSLQIDHSKPSETVEATAHESLNEYTRLIEDMQAKLADVGKAPTREQVSGGNNLSEGSDPITTSMLGRDETPERDGTPEKDEIPERDETPERDEVLERNEIRERDEMPERNGTLEIDETPLANDGWSSASDIDEVQPAGGTYTNESSIIPEIGHNRIHRQLGSIPQLTPTEDQNFDGLRPNIDSYKVPLRLKGGLTSPQWPRSESPLATASRSNQSVDSELDLSDQILNSISASSPSPKKARHTLSLAERTRLSMSRASHSQFSEIHDDVDSLADLPVLPTKSRPQPTAPSSSGEGEEKHSGLIERTRKSMAGFEAAQKNAQLERRRSVKDAKKRQRESSYFPPLNEEPTMDLNAVGLIEEDPDYESVFKSRPKIKTSPAVSPTRV